MTVRTFHLLTLGECDENGESKNMVEGHVCFRQSNEPVLLLMFVQHARGCQYSQFYIFIVAFGQFLLMLILSYLFILYFAALL